jgi:dolichol-phosphate mannosyltransferase
VPTRNEADNVGSFVSRLSAALRTCGLEWELVFVDDSDDGTAEALRQLSLSTPTVHLAHRPPGARQGGLGGAVNAGFELARGEVVAVMDADLQHPPEVLVSYIRTHPPTLVRNRINAGNISVRHEVVIVGHSASGG